MNEKIEAKPEKTKINGIAKRFAQANWKKTLEEILKELKKTENTALLAEIKERPILLVRIGEKINGIRFDQRNRDPTAPRDITMSESMVFELLGQNETAIKESETKIIAETPVSKNPNGREKVLWAGSFEPIKAKNSGIKKDVHAKNTATPNRGHIISLMQATRGKPLRKKVKDLKGNDKGISVQTCIYAGMQDPVGVEVAIDGAQISELNGSLTVQVGDLRITGVPPEEISGGILRGLFDLDVVARLRSDEKKPALFPKLAFREHLNGAKPVYVASIDKIKEELLALGSLHTTPSYNGDILHLKLKAE